MYCRNCGNELDEKAAICPSCGFKNGDGDKICPHCGKEVKEGAQVCLSCGYSLEKSTKTSNENISTKSKLTAGLLGIFLGGLGIHNFYLGYTGKGIAQIFLNLCCCAGAIWGTIEGILLLCGKINKDAKGQILQK